MAFLNTSKQSCKRVRPTDASWKLSSRKAPDSDLIGKRLGMVPRNEYAQRMLNILSHIGGTLIEGGADTTSAFLQTLVLALVNFPEVQARAQQELDSVIGDERPPQLDDIERLPYIQAVIKEVRSTHQSQGSSSDLTVSDPLDAPLATRRS